LGKLKEVHLKKMMKKNVAKNKSLLMKIHQLPQRMRRILGF